MMCIELPTRSHKTTKFVAPKYALRHLRGGIVPNLFAFTSTEILKFKYDEMYSNSDRTSGNLPAPLADVIQSRTLEKLIIKVCCSLQHMSSARENE